MNTYFYRLVFKTPVHFGQGRLSSTGATLFADTLFSALYKEAINIGRADELLSFVKNDSMTISDLFPYNGQTYFLPKPIMSIKTDKKGNSSLKKKFKGLTHIPVEDIDDYIRGDYDPDKANRLLDAIGKKSMRQSVRVVDDNDNEPYYVGVFTFYDECGLYFAASVDDEAKKLLDMLIKYVGFTGIGGKRSSGFGKFSVKRTDADSNFVKHIHDNGIAMSLSICLPSDSELDEAMVDATYETVKRSGFVESDSYSNTPIRKKDLYCFKAGSVFHKRFCGDIYDVSIQEGTHPVYRYAKPMWFSVDRS